MSQQPEALQLANELDATNDDAPAARRVLLRAKAAAELRRLHEENASLRREVAALSANALDDYREIERLKAAQRQWVGLTLADKEEFLAQDIGGSRLDAMDWAARKLKEKNHG